MMLVAAVVVIGFIAVQSWRSAKEQEKAIDGFSATIPLGMSRSQASQMLETAVNEHPGWRYRPTAFSHSAVAALESPLAVGATNHVVYVVFDRDVVSAVLVRTEDTARYRPSNAPQDRLLDSALSVLKDFN
jgi:hypothetical protein